LIGTNGDNQKDEVLKTNIFRRSGGQRMMQPRALLLDELVSPEIAALITSGYDTVLGDVLLHAINQMRVDFVQRTEGDFGAGLTVGAGIGAHGGVIRALKFPAQQGHDLANRFAAGAIGRLDLIEKAPESDIEREDAPAAIGAGRRSREQGLWNVGSKGLAKHGKGTAFRALGESLCERGNRALSKEEGAESFEKRSGMALYDCKYIYSPLTDKIKSQPW